MATRQQLHAARNSALKLARVVQPYSQSDLILGNESATAARAEVQAAAAAAVTDATAIAGGTSAAVANGATITMTDQSNGPSLPGTATVAANAITNVKLDATTAAIVQHADVVPVQQFDGSAGTSSPTAVVAAGAETAVKLTSIARVVTNGSKHACGTVSGSGTFATFTISGGIITGIVLSAS